MSSYPRLPDELKLRIWEYAFENLTPGVHHFKIMTGKAEVELRPFADGGLDNSAWRERRKIAGISGVADDAIRPFEDGRVVFKDTAHRRRIKTDENGIEAAIDGTMDLVCLRMTGNHLDMRALSNRDTQAVFADLTRIGIDYKLFAGNKGADAFENQFACVCPQRSHQDKKYCHYAIAEFLRQFKDLECFYFTFKLTAGEIIEAVLAGVPARGKKRTHGGKTKNSEPEPQPVAQSGAKRGAKVKKPKAGQLIPATLKRFKDIGKEKDLEVYNDKKGTYYEVLRDDTRRVLVKHRDIWSLVLSLQGNWQRTTQQLRDGPVKQQAAKVKFKVLVYADNRYYPQPPVIK
ncbi:Uu.00g140850.m01.CDS01 [Anthostomella pinea]|uniref:Uu.00g140850.m01.CDS01 n=1 Tax=Anthostomella pinea TaxID=933095 RepID=A0AAI8VQZ3_9PEZI|nr:Uu.00g140850.m01.CDS01 [Anthostomella pinea]